MYKYIFVFNNKYIFAFNNKCIFVLNESDCEKERALKVSVTPMIQASMMNWAAVLTGPAPDDRKQDMVINGLLTFPVPHTHTLRCIY